MKTDDLTNTGGPANACPRCGTLVPAEAPQGLCPKCLMAGLAAPTEAGVPPAATSEIPSLERVAAAFPQLEILELVGRGGMGFVFKARQPHLDRFVALKLLGDRMAREAHFTERFNREGRVLARLSHPNIVSIYDFGQAGGFCYLLMEFVDGVNLRQAMRTGRFSPAEALSIVPKVCEALQYAHEQGVLHRDIKPENILLDAKGRVKIADFGIAKLVGEDRAEVTLTATGSALGTPHYMAPEQLEKPAEVDHRADIYSLGVVFYEMLTGELPIGRFAPPSEKTPVDHRVDDVVFRTLEKEREKRYQSAGEVKTEVETLSSAPPVIDPESSEPAPQGPHGTVVMSPPAPRWLRGVGILYTVFGVLGLVAMLNNLASGKLAFGSFLLLGMTGAALLTRQRVLRRVALVANIVGLLMPWFAVLNLSAGMQDGVFALSWKPVVEGEDSLGLAMLFALLENAAVASGLLVLLRHDVKVWFEFAGRTRTPRRFPGDHTAARFSRSAIWGAVLTGLSLPLPLGLGAALLLGHGGIGPWELLIVLGCVALLAVPGNVLGWMGLSELRAHSGRLHGMPLAVFAALAWPLMVLVVVFVGTPVFTITASRPSGPARFVGPLLLFLVPAGIFTFALWAVHATVRWASGQAPTQRRGVLKWVFLAVLGCGVGIALLIGIPSGRGNLQVVERHMPAPVVESAPADPIRAGTEPLRVKFKVRKGQVATFMLCRHKGQEHEPMPEFSTFVVAPDDEAAAGEVRLEPVAPERVADLSQLNWTLAILTEEGARIGTGLTRLGPLRLLPGVTMPLRVPDPSPPHHSLEVPLTHWNPDDPANAEAIIQPALGLSVVFETRPTELRAPDLPLVGSGTNWSRSLQDWLAAGTPPPDTNQWIRFTFMAVELRDDAGARWLAIDYVDDVHGNCERGFRWEANIPDFKAETRTTAFVAEPKGSPPVRHQRVEYKLPGFLDRAEAQQIRDDLAKGMIAKSIVAHIGHDAPLFRLPLGTNGTLAAWVSARSKIPAP